MRKQNSELLLVCKCQEYSEQLSKIRAKLTENLSIAPSFENHSAYKLLKMQLYASKQKQNFIENIQQQLRSFAKQNPKIEYSDWMTISEMIGNLMLRIKKEKTILISAHQKEREMSSRYVQENRTAAEEIDYLKQLLIEQQNEQEAWKLEVLKQEMQIHSIKKEIELKKEQNRLHKELAKKLQHRISSLEAKISSLQVKISSLEKDKAQLSRDFLQKCEEVAKLASNFQSFKRQISYKSKLELNEHIQTLKAEFFNDCNPESIRLSIKNTQSHDKLNLFNHLFVGDVLFNEEECRHFMIEVVQNHQKNAIVRSKLLYKMDLINTANIHRYIDGIPHLIIFIRTERGQIIAAYSQGAFKAKTISNRDGILMNLSTQKTFKNSKKAIIYDESEVIFGNYDLRLKNNDSKLVSNFASNASFYELKGETVHSLLGQGKNREVKMKNFEIFQVFYEV